MTKEKLVWRLGKLPSVEELRDLVKDKILTNDEAREILFNKETEKESDKNSELEFLRDLVRTLSYQANSRGAITTVYYPARYQTATWLSGYTSGGTNTLGNFTLTASNSVSSPTLEYQP